MKHVVVVGGGIAGLTTAYTLQEEARAAGLPLIYTLLERSKALGGKIVTEQVDGFVIEGGPDSFLSQKPWAADLCRRLGLGDELIGTNYAQRQVFVLSGGRLVPLPEGMMLVVPTRLGPFLASPLISWPGKLRMSLDLLIPPRRDGADESLAHFVRRRLGREALEKLAEPLMSGIYVADPERQSLLGTFARFRDLETKHGSLIRGALAQRRATGPAQTSSNGASAPSSTFLSLRGGLAQLVSALEAALHGGRVLTEVGVARVAVGTQGRPPLQVETDSGEVFEADAVVLATPAYTSAALVSELLPDLSEALGRIRYVSTATVSLGFARAALSHPLNGFGFVVPRSEGRRILGCTWTSTKLPQRAPADMALLRCFVGGPDHEELVGLGDDELVALVRDELRAIMGVTATPRVTRVFRWHKANPQYDVGHPERVRDMYALCARQPGLFLAGSAFEGVGIPDCVRQAQETARKLLASFAEQPQRVDRGSSP